MQLPRGTFREIRKSTRISALMEEFERTRFTGICTISGRGITGTLVFRSGRCILASLAGMQGDPAWDEIKTMHVQNVDAAIATLDDTQIQLSLEFNAQFRVMKTSWIPRESVQISEPRKPLPRAHEREAAIAGSHPGHSPGESAGKETEPKGLHRPLHPKREPEPGRNRKITESPVAKQNAPVIRHPEEKAGQPDNEELYECEPKDSFSEDMDSLDSMDIEDVTRKIRADCKTVVKRLDLEHLMER